MISPYVWIFEYYKGQLNRPPFRISHQQALKYKSVVCKHFVMFNNINGTVYLSLESYQKQVLGRVNKNERYAKFV